MPQTSAANWSDGVIGHRDILFDDKTFHVKSGLTKMVFSGTLLTLLKVHNIRKSSECLIKFQLLLKALFSDKIDNTWV